MSVKNSKFHKYLCELKAIFENALILCAYLSNVPTAPMKLVGGGFEPWTFCLPLQSANNTQEAGGWRI